MHAGQRGRVIALVVGDRARFLRVERQAQRLPADLVGREALHRIAQVAPARVVFAGAAERGVGEHAAHQVDAVGVAPAAVGGDVAGDPWPEALAEAVHRIVDARERGEQRAA
jgi:hypothetical protein